MLDVVQTFAFLSATCARRSLSLDVAPLVSQVGSRSAPLRPGDSRAGPRAGAVGAGVPLGKAAFLGRKHEETAASRPDSVSAPPSDASCSSCFFSNVSSFSCLLPNKVWFWGVWDLEGTPCVFAPVRPSAPREVGTPSAGSTGGRPEGAWPRVSEAGQCRGLERPLPGWPWVAPCLRSRAGCRSSHARGAWGF